MRYSNGFAIGWRGNRKPKHDAPRNRRATDREIPGSMAKRSDRNLIVGLDIGTSKVVAIVGEMHADGSLEVIGLGTHPSRGLKKGVVVNIDSTVQSIQRAVEEAELMAGFEIRSVYTGIAGSHVRSLNSHGIVAIKDKEVASGDVARVMDAAQAVAIPADQKILHVLPAGIHHRRPGRHPRADRHVGRAPRGARAHRHRRRERRAEHRQVRAALRARGRGHRARAARLVVRGADRRREGARRLPRRHRRRHHRHRRLLRRRDPAHGRDPDRRRPGDERHRGLHAHADPVCRGDQDPVRLRAVAAREPGRDDRGALASATGRRAASRARRSRRSSSRATRSCSC